MDLPSSQLLQARDAEAQMDIKDYTVEVTGLKVLFIPSVDILQKFLYSRWASQGIDQSHCLLKKMDLFTEFQEQCIETSCSDVEAKNRNDKGQVTKTVRVRIGTNSQIGFQISNK